MAPFPKGRPQALEREDRKRARDQQAAELREAIRTRDSNRCRVCRRLVYVGAVRGCDRAEIHHIVARSLAPDRVMDETNLILVCGLCHAKLTAHELAFSGTNQARVHVQRGPNWRPGR